MERNDWQLIHLHHNKTTDKYEAIGFKITKDCETVKSLINSLVTLYQNKYEGITFTKLYWTTTEFGDLDETSELLWTQASGFTQPESFNQRNPHQMFPTDGNGIFVFLQ